MSDQIKPTHYCTHAIDDLRKMQGVSETLAPRSEAVLVLQLSEQISHKCGTPAGGTHAWLTLPSMEIIDLTLPTSFAWVNGYSEGEGGIIADHPDRLKGGLKFHPMLVGSDFLWESGAIRLEYANADGCSGLVR